MNAVFPLLAIISSIVAVVGFGFQGDVGGAVMSVAAGIWAALYLVEAT